MPKRIFIGGLSVATTDSTINTEFSPFGSVVTAAVNRDASGASLGNANVTYTTDQAGSDAITAKNGTQIDGSTISVAQAR
jgi:RNA recognition motif-containing protein